MMNGVQASWRQVATLDRGVRLVAAAVIAGAVGTVEAGSLSVSVQQQQTFGVNLTALGTSDWAVWGMGSSTSLSPDARMSGGSGISNLTPVYGDPTPPVPYSLRGLGQFNDYGQSSFDWTNGTAPNGTGTGTWAGLQVDANGGTIHTDDTIGTGFSMTAAANTSTQQLLLFTTVHRADARLRVSLSDGSAALIDTTVQADPTRASYGNVPFVFAITYAANSAAQTLNIEWVVTVDYDGTSSDGANAAIAAAALSLVGAPVPGAGLAVLAGLGLAGSRRRR